MTNRRRLFKVALAAAGVTARSFAQDNQVTYGHLQQVLSGRESGRLEAIIDAFIQEHAAPFLPAA